MATKKKAAPPEEPAREAGASDFPRHSLEQALAVATALEEKNGGNPLSPMDLAIALDRGPASSDYRVLLSSSIKYGLTGGSYNQPRVQLQELGRELVQPRSDEGRRQAIIAAALKPQLFRAVYEHYKGKRLPDPAFFRNVLVREFGIVQGGADLFAKIFLANADFVGLVRQASTGKFLGSIDGGLLSPVRAETEERERSAVEEDGRGSSAGNTPAPSPPASPASAVQTGTEAEISLMKRVFVTHGKNRAFIETIKKLLGFGELQPVVSVETQSVSQPVPDKVIGEMRGCGGAIIHVDAERRLIDQDAKEHVMLNPNVLIEIGAAQALYGRRLVLFVRDGVELPSNLQGLYTVRYSGDTLDSDATIKLLEAINELKKHPLPNRYVEKPSERP